MKPALIDDRISRALAQRARRELRETFGIACEIDFGDTFLNALFWGSLKSLADRVDPTGFCQTSYGEENNIKCYGTSHYPRDAAEAAGVLASVGLAELGTRILRFSLEHVPEGQEYPLEGFLFPDTYEFYVKENADSALSRLLSNFQDRIMDDPDIAPLLANSSYSLKEIVIMASLIEKETDGTDRAVISSVIHNRLENVGETAHLLQIDASLVYAAGREITEDDYQTLDSPYNLYTHQGLPPTAIANAGKASIVAALKPDKTNYYFYVLNPDTQRHVFSRTLAEHNANLRKFG